MLEIRTVCAQNALVRIPPAREAIVSWNTRLSKGSIALTIHRTDGRVSSRLPYVAFSESERRSCNGRDEIAEIAVDTIRAPVEITAIEVHADIPLDAVAVTVPCFPPAGVRQSKRAHRLDVPEKSQYADVPSERGWCSPAALSMLLAYWGFTLTVQEAAMRVYDADYGGTGNWTFNTALAGTLGLRGVVAHLRDLAHASRFIEAGLPIALSFAWKSGELPGAPIEHSGGHLAVLRGFTEQGDPIFNDPAQNIIPTTYPYEAYERTWRTHGAIAYLIAPLERSDELLHLVNTP